MRLIDADAAADKIMRETEKRADDLNMIGIALMIGIARMLRDENDFPTVEAEPVRHGRWIEAEDDNGKDGIVCSECGHFVPFDYEYFDNPSHLKQDNKICNNCGAIMKNGGAENG